MGSAQGAAWHDEAGLDAVRFLWGEAYEIGFGAVRRYWAKRHGSAAPLIEAEDAEELGRLIAEDYAFRSVPRQRTAVLSGGAS